MADGGIDQQSCFISRSGNDAEVGIVVARILNAAGHKTYLQDDDFGHASFMARMAEGWSSGARLICLLSKAYQQSQHCKKEYEVALKDDPRNLKERVIVLRIEECVPVEHLADLAFTDLVPLLKDAERFARVLRGAVGPREPKEADFAALYRRSPGQIIHPEIRPVPGFTGREAELEAVEAALWGKGGTAALTNMALPRDASAAQAAMKGLGGVGKSVLAQEYAWRNRARYHGVWWIRAEKAETLLDDLIELGAKLIPGLAEVKDRAQAAHATLAAIAQMKAEKPWLIVYDNVEQPGDIDKLTPTEGAHVLITTRWPDWHGHAAELPVGVFSPPVAVEFLLAHARKGDPEAAARLAADLGYLPLALAHARALAWSEGWDFERYRQKLPELIRKAPRGAAYPAPVFATFDLAIAKAARLCPHAETLMGICAFLAPDRIPLDIVTEDVMSEGERGAAVAALAEVSLLTLEPLDDGSTGISVHRLVQEVMRGRLRAKPSTGVPSPLVGEGQGGGESPTSAHVAPPTPIPSPQGGGEEFAALATRLVADAYPAGDIGPDDVRSWPACRRLESHVIAVLEVASDTGEAASSTARLLNQYALHLSARADHGAAEPLMRRALAIDETSLGPDHPDVATDLNNLAQLLQATNRLAEAEPLMRRALAIDETSFGPDHPNVAIRLNNLAALLQATNRLAEAEPLMRRALAIDETSFGPDHPNVATDLNNLAALLQATNRLAEAEPLMRRALAIDETSFGPDHPNVATDLNNLALLLQATNRLAEAEPLMRRALAIDETSFGPDHPKVAIRPQQPGGCCSRPPTGWPRPSR